MISQADPKNTEKINILYIIDELMGAAGAEKNLFDLVTHINLRLYNPIVVCLKGGALVETFKQKNVEIYNMDVKRIYSLRAFVKSTWLFKLIKSRNVKIMVTYHESSDYLGLFLGKISGVPLIVSSRRDMGYKLKSRHFALYKRINVFFDKIITVSDGVKNLIFDKQDALWNRLITIYNGVEFEKYEIKIDKSALRKSLGIGENDLVIGILAVLRPIKGHKYFLDAARLILNDFPQAKFLVVGSYEDKNYFEELKSIVKTLDMEHNVIFTGWRSDTGDIISIMDIFVNSSISEGFSNAVLEAMALGKPVVATNVGGTPESVVNGKTGLLVSPCNSKELADSILSFLRDMKKASQMGLVGMTRAKETFSIDAMMNKIEKLYEELLDKKSAEREKEIKPDEFKSLCFRTIKFFISHFLYYSGLLYFLRKLFQQDKSVKILTYHRVNDNEFNPLGMSVTVDNFEKQIRFISKKYNVISLKQAVTFLKGEGSIPKNPIVITFDDGYEDNYINAYPILRKYNVPATIFLTVEAIEQKHQVWLDVIEKAFVRTILQDVDLRRFKLRHYKLDSSKNKESALKETVAYAKRLSHDEINDFINEIIKSLAVDGTEINNTFSMLRWDEIISMSNDSISFGSHGMTHTILNKLSLKEAESEIAQSKAIMKERANIDTDTFAYPNGRSQDYNSDIIRLLKKHGYSASCSLIEGSNRRATDRFSLRRLCVNEGSSIGIGNLFSKEIFAAIVSGVFRPNRMF